MLMMLVFVFLQYLSSAPALRAFTFTVQHTEDLWKRTHSAVDFWSFKPLQNRYLGLILASEKK